MVTKEEFINGVLSYVDQEVIPQLPTMGKWGIGTCVVLMKNRAEMIINSLTSNQLAKALGVVDEKGLIDSDALMNALHTSAETYGNLQIIVPIVGTLTFTSSDVDRLRTFINGGNRS